MKKIRVSLQLCFLIILIASVGFAQDDETRQATGLPMKIGDDSAKANLSGKILMEGLDASQPKPTIFVSALVNGVTIGRRRASDTGNYFIPEVPRENVTVIVEINGEEVGRQMLIPTSTGSLRQDFVINAAQWRSAKAKTGVISAKEVYTRSTENEKLFQKATTAAKDKKTDNAIKFFKQILENDPKDFVVWTDFGSLYFSNGNFPEAEKCYLTALEQKPDFLMAILNLSRLYLNQKQPEKVIPILTKTVETESSSADVNHYLGEAYLQTKQGSKAIVYLNEAIKLAPIEKAEIHLRLAWLYHAAGIKDKAVEEYKQFLRKVPKYPDKEKIEKYIKENSPQ
ncbi:MAG TPA: tetratricopeptide repeat protein [Pyrinomonadaceae bacterium]|nr:tetratricopeptide repeat protein [Pyrinomonadaceae bacterium]